MRYVEPIFRPGPTEYDSYLLQVSIGCAHNKCTFCSFFKDKPFRTRPLEEIKEDLALARKYYTYDPPVFLIDGDATYYTMDKLRPILQEIRKTFPDSPHTNMYARFGDIYKRYSVDDLKEMKELNVKFLYMGSMMAVIRIIFRLISYKASLRIIWNKKKCTCCRE